MEGANGAQRRQQYGYGSMEGSDDALLGENLLILDSEHGETPLTSNMSDVTYSLAEPNGLKGYFRWRNESIQSIIDDENYDDRSRRRAANAARAVLVTLVAVCLCTLTYLLSPSEIQPDQPSPSSGGVYVPGVDVPFQNVDRSQYHDPVKKFIDLDLFHYKLRPSRNDRQKVIVPSLGVPFPTGAFWTNLVTKTPFKDKLSFPVVCYPYAFRWNPSTLQISYPNLRRKLEPTMMSDRVEPDLRLGSREQIAKRSIMEFDPLSVTTRFQVRDGVYWEIYMVQGSPYLTMKYEQTSPVITAFSIFTDIECPTEKEDQISAICSRISPPPKMSTAHITYFEGVRFLLRTQEGNTWILFSSKPIVLSWDTDYKRIINTVGAFSGILRLAFIPPEKYAEEIPIPFNSTTLSALSRSTGYRKLVRHGGIYPVGCKVSWKGEGVEPSYDTWDIPEDDHLKMLSTPPADEVAVVHFKFEVRSFSAGQTPDPDDPSTELLMLALPHHVDVLNDEVVLGENEFDLVYRCIKGNMRAVASNTWVLHEELAPTLFDNVEMMKRIAEGNAFSETTRNIILKNVEDDLGLFIPAKTENIYGYGKQLGRLAQLAHITDVLYATTTDDSMIERYNSTLSKAMAVLEARLVDVLTGGISDKLLYDANLGGIVSRVGLLGPGADFGNGRYNDHHFHYGYVLYACAIMGRLNPDFVSNYGDHVDSLMFDIVYSSNSNSNKPGSAFFPFVRHKSWFDGHSFASGLFPMGNGKSQESSSEAVNAYYGAYLWTSVRASHSGGGHWDDLVLFARLLLAMEIRGAQKYWHMFPGVNDIYDPQLSQHYMVGVLGMLDVTCRTWFGDKTLYLHMINFIPITAITKNLFDDYNGTYVKEEYKTSIAPLMPNVEMAWRGYTISDLALSDPVAAWEEGMKLVSGLLDSAASKSQILYWTNVIAGSEFVPPADNSDNNNPASDGSKVMCDANKVCAAAGLLGACCPTGGNIMLDCCDTGR